MQLSNGPLTKAHRLIISIRVLLLGMLHTMGIARRSHGEQSFPLTKCVKSQFEHEASIYDASRDVWVRGYRGEGEQTLIKRYLTGNSVLEVGAGTGRVMTRLARKHGYCGIDISHNMLKTAKEKASTERLDVDLLVMDGEHLGFRQNAFDSVVISRTLKYLQSPAKALSEVRHILRANGRSIVSCETGDNIWHRMLARGSGNLVDIRFTVGEIIGLLQDAGFNIIDANPMPSLLSPYFGAHRIVRAMDKMLGRSRISAWVVIGENG